ncbi:MAG TPA: hypothetical protein VFD80_05990 [Flavobacteriaceae bacterium]|nr:hypothetical protein [Flavobacteriaceae bacterium]
MGWKYTLNTILQNPKSKNPAVVKTATWNIGIHQLSLLFDKNKTTLQTIEENIAAAGYDTDNVKAPKEAYEDLHYCCKYRDEEVVGQHPE